MLCPICNRWSSPVKSKYLPHFVTCSVCDGNFLIKKVKGNYPREYFQQESKPSSLVWVISWFFGLLYNQKIDNLLNLVRGKSRPTILDYGCGAGKLVEILTKKGISVYGYEPSLGALKITRQKGLPIYPTVHKVKGGYDLIMMWHSLEHTSNPYQVVKNVKKQLKKGGRILIAIPNANNFEVMFAKDKWFHYTYPLHLIHFTPKSIKMLLDQLGFKHISIDYINPEYTWTGLVQTFLNLFLPKDVLYSLVCNRRIYLSKFQTLMLSLFSIGLLIICLPILLIIYSIELIFKKTDAMLITAQG